MKGVKEIVALEPYQSGSAPGVSKLVMSADKQYIAAGFHDQKLRLYNSMSWSELFGFDHSWEELTDLNSSDVLNIYQERDGGDGTYYDAMSRPFKVP